MWETQILPSSSLLRKQQQNTGVHMQDNQTTWGRPALRYKNAPGLQLSTMSLISIEISSCGRYNSIINAFLYIFNARAKCMLLISGRYTDRCPELSIRCKSCGINGWVTARRTHLHYRLSHAKTQLWWNEANDSPLITAQILYWQPLIGSQLSS